VRQVGQFAKIILRCTVSKTSKLDRPVLASCDSLFKGLPRHVHPFGLKFSIIFGIFLLLVVANLIYNILVSSNCDIVEE
jgi:hypothetical protein